MIGRRGGEVGWRVFDWEEIKFNTGSSLMEKHKNNIVSLSGGKDIS